MAELGQDISGHKPMTFEELEDWEGLNFDLIITLSPEAHHKALELTRTLAADVEYWPTPDPTGTEGSREQKLARLSRSLRRPDDAHPPAVRQGGRGERISFFTVVPANAGTHTPRPCDLRRCQSPDTHFDHDRLWLWAPAFAGATRDSGASTNHLFPGCGMECLPIGSARAPIRFLNP